MTFTVTSSTNIATEDDVCKLTIYLRSPKEKIEMAVGRSLIVDFYKTINTIGQRFVNINGVGIPIERIVRYEEGDMDGKSVIASASLCIPHFDYIPYQQQVQVAHK